MPGSRDDFGFEVLKKASCTGNGRFQVIEVLLLPRDEQDRRIAVAQYQIVELVPAPESNTSGRAPTCPLTMTCVGPNRVGTNIISYAAGQRERTLS